MWLKQQLVFLTDVTESQDVILRSADGFVQGAFAQGVSEATLKMLLRHDRHLGSSLLPADLKLEAGEVLMGGDLGDIMGLFEGDRVTALPPEDLVSAVDAKKQVESLKVKEFVRTKHRKILILEKFIINWEKTLQRFRNPASLERTLESSHTSTRKL